MVEKTIEKSSKEENAKDTETTKKEEVKGEQVEEMSEEDIKLKDDLEMLVERLEGSDKSLHLPALNAMVDIIRASTTSMTSVPKPLKFMRPHYAKMKQVFEKFEDGSQKKLCADIISVLAMTCDDKRDCLEFRLKGSLEPIGNWGHEYVRHLTMEVADEWRYRASNVDHFEDHQDDLLSVVREILTHNMRHNAEVEACDLLIEIERLDVLPDFVEEIVHSRVCHYLLSCAPLTPYPDNHNLITAARIIYQRCDKDFEGLRCAVMLNDTQCIKEIFSEIQDSSEKKQAAILLGRHQIFIDMADDNENKILVELNSNKHLHSYFLSLARELDILEPKTPEGIYKSHLEPSKYPGTAMDQTRTVLAGSFVNAFVNMGFCSDKTVTTSDESNRWLFKHKDYGLMSAAASLGLIFRWDLEVGLTQCDRFFLSSDEYVKAGGLLGVGIISSGIQDECDPACAILSEHLHSDRAIMRIGSIMGLGLAYANSKRETVYKNEPGGVIYELKRVIVDTAPSATSEVKGLAGLALGFILVGTGDNEVATDMLHILMEKTPTDLLDPNMRFFALGIALIFLGQQDKSEVFVESLRILPEPFGSMMSTLLDVCSFAGSGNVLKIQNLLHICSEHYEPKDAKKKSDKKKESEATAKKDDEKPDLSSQQAVAVLGIGLIAMCEEIGIQMSLRTFGHLIRYGEPVIRRAVPLALALISVSNPHLTILETLSKFSHDSDPETAHNAVFAMGLVGAGTNNARLVAMLRQLASYYYKDQVSLMLVRIAQGLVHLGKGTVTMNPFHSDRQLLCPAAVAGLFATCFVFLDANNSVLCRQHYLLYSLVLSMQPRMLITLMEDETCPSKLKQVNVSVRVGQAVDVVAQAGKPKTITGFQTHTTPVLMAYGERAELANDEYISMTPYIEGLVILKKNPNYEAAHADSKKK